MTSTLTWQSSGAPTHGVIGDTNTMRISPDYLGMAQDVIIDTTGILRNRGGFRLFSSDVFTNLAIKGAAQLPLSSLTQSGTVALVYDSNLDATFFYGTKVAALTGFAKLTSACQGNNITAAALQTGAYLSPSWARLKDDKGFIMGAGTTQTGFNAWNFACIWGGNAVTTNSTVTGTAAATLNSRAVVGVGTAWTTALEGCYLFIGAGAAAQYVGQVDKVTSTTALSLVKCAISTVAAAAPSFKTTRAIMYNVYKGRVTTNTASSTVVGSNTKWTTCGPGGSGAAWMTATSLYRYSDGGYIGTVSAVNNDTTITLIGNAALALVNEEYYAINGSFSGTYKISQGRSSGAISAGCVEGYADRFWYGNIAASDEAIRTTNLYYSDVVSAPYVASNTIAFSKKGDPECLDLDPVSGDTITLPTGNSSDCIRTMVAVRGGMLVFRLNDTFLLTGYSPETFRIVKIVDDGCLYNATAKPYKNGVIWAGRKSMWYFDGTRVTDVLSGEIKNFYNRIGGSLGQNTSLGAGMAIASEHVMFSTYTGGVTWPYKNTTKTLNYVTFVINMANGALSFFTNLYVLNGLTESTGTQLIFGNNVSAYTSSILNGDTVFNDSSTAADNFDAVTGVATFSSGTQIGPDVMFETTKLPEGDATLMKTFKRFLLNYSSAVGMTTTLIGTNDTTWDFPNISTGTVSSDVFAVSSNVGILHRIRFLLRAPFIAVRVYQTATTTATSQRFKLFFWSLGFKKLRKGRVQP